MSAHRPATKLSVSGWRSLGGLYAVSRGGGNGRPAAVVGGATPATKTFKPCPIGFLRLDTAQLQTAEGRLTLFVALIAAAP